MKDIRVRVIIVLRFKIPFYFNIAFNFRYTFLGFLVWLIWLILVYILFCEQFSTL